ncbi:MAG: hypothetical protein JW795_22355 [Chitinivibrionales bacterium]|nr:hypothetical protein [Chitinivibrionales bacterium]
MNLEVSINLIIGSIITIGTIFVSIKFFVLPSSFQETKHKRESVLKEMVKQEQDILPQSLGDEEQESETS